MPAGKTLEGIGWEWQSLDGCMVKAPLALESVGRNPADRGKMGTKRSALTDEKGLPTAWPCLYSCSGVSMSMTGGRTRVRLAPEG